MPQDKVSFVDKAGLRQELEVGLHHYAEAQKKSQTLRQYINNTYPTAVDSKYDTFTQVCASAGLNFASIPELGIRPVTMQEVIFGAAGPQTLEVSPVQSRVLFPAAILELVESKLQKDRGSAVAAFNTMLADTVTVAGSRVEQPVIDYTRAKGPESSRMKARAQLAEPEVMMTITASEKTLTIPETALSVLISDQALQGTTVDMVGLALTRQAEVESFLRIGEDLRKILSGDADAGSYGTAALAQTKADVYDATIGANGTVTQACWLAYLYENLADRRIDTIVTDIAGANAIDGRTNRPTAQTDKAKDRIDADAMIFYPNLVEQVRIFVMPAAFSWPANTVMGFDSKYAMRKWVNSYAAYSDVERFVLRRGSAFVVSYGEKITRIFDDAFSVLSLTYT
jgi:hypothetical protein